ncbi:MAG: NHL repeat-containing protein [Planctomycetota bacterium]
MLPLLLVSMLLGDGRFGGFQAEIRGLAEPASVAIGGNEEVFVLESLTSRVRVFDAAGLELRSFGARGSGPGELLEPQGLAIAPDGEIYVSDTGNDRVQVYSKEGQFLRNVGIRGAGMSEFNTPLGLAVDAQRIWVADSRNHRIQVFLRNGRFVAEVGRFGHGEGGLDHPSDVAVDEDWNVYVADTDNQRIQVFDKHAKFVRAFGAHGPYAGLFLTPSGIRYHGGLLYVADRDNHRIQVYDKLGTLQHEWGVHALRPREGGGKVHYPNQVAIAPSGRFAAIVEGFENRAQLFGAATEESETAQRSQEKSTGSHYGPAIDSAGPTMLLLEPSAPAFLVFSVERDEPVEVSRFGTFGSKAGQLVRPEGIAIDRKAGRAYVCDPGLGRLSVFEVARPIEEELRYIPDLVRFVKSIDFRALADSTKSAHPWPIEPTAIEQDGNGDLWIVDAANRRIVVIDERARLRRTIGERFLRPTDLALSPSGKVVYVVDAAACRVQAFDSGGELLQTFGNRGVGPTDFVRPFGITVDAEANVYVSDEAGHKIVKFDAGGKPVAAFGREGLGRVEFFKPKGLAFDARGRLVIVDWGNHRGQVVSGAGEFIRSFGARFFIQPTLN